jgi:hypothetical protein
MTLRVSDRNRTQVVPQFIVPQPDALAQPSFNGAKEKKVSL